MLRWPICFLAVTLFGTNVFAGGKASTATHPVVPAFERFFANAPLEAVKGGQLLLGELNCISCHRPDKTHEPYVARRQAPVLDGVGNRVRRVYLRKFLADPHAVKPGTAMPHVFAGIPDTEKAEKVEALVHFLASTGTLPQERPEKKLIAGGRDLYQKVGCVVCHGTRDAAGNQAKLFSTSIPLGDLKAKYSLTSLRMFLENPHQTRPAGRMPTLLIAKEAQEVANYLLQGATVDALPNNMTYAYYEGFWNKVPDFSALKPKASGETSGFDLSVARRKTEFALRFEGYLRIERDGDYSFHVTSDDGSKLFLDGKQVVNNDGIHAPATKSGVAKLNKRMHKLTVGVFNAGGGVELQVEIEGPGLGRQSISPFVYLTPEGDIKKVAKSPTKDDEHLPVQPELVDKGRELFASVGCANCHTLKVGNATVVSKVTAPDLGQLKPAGGCLEKMPAKSIPSYGLSSAQQTALTAALKAQPPAAPPAPAEVVARSLTTFNCYACHQRDKVGGVEDELNPLFATSQPEMGDEARIPPILNGVGAKLNAAYLKKVLDKGAHDRPYMHTRMPGFGDANVGHLVTLFASLDNLQPVTAVSFSQTATKVKSEARHMVGGEGLGCIKCHTFAGNKAEGVQGMDLIIMPERVKRDWFHRYLLDPNKFRPGTRMPTAWFNGVSPLPKVLEGEPAKQIEAIWVYLAEGKKAQLPLGVKKQFMPLIPDKEAIVYRNFLEGSGARAIGVGYPEKAHLAFDANNIRLAMLWQGAFIDASRHWTDRGVGYEPPLGDGVLHLPSGPTFAVLTQDDEPWPTKNAKELGYKFGGYRLSPDQRPTFLYSFQDIRIEDFPNAVTGKMSPSILRTVSLTATKDVANLWFRAAQADKIEALSDGWFRVNNDWKMRLDPGMPARVRQSSGKMELLIPLQFKEGRARIVQEFVW